jgi:tetratricopeptide (TPR) repeat protein
MQVKTSLTLAVAFALALPMALRADDAAPAAASGTAAAPAADASASTPTAKATPVVKNDAPGSITPGNQLNDDGKYADAIAYFQGIGEQTTSNGHKKREPWRLIGLATAEIGAGKFDDAAADAQKAIDIDPLLGTAWNDLGSALAQSGKRGDAIAAYNKGIAGLKAAGKDTSKLEANLAPLQAIQDKIDKKNGKVPASTSPTAAADSSAATGTASATTDTAK